MEEPKSIFDGAKIGDKFITRDGHIAVFYNHHNTLGRVKARFVTMILSGKESIYLWRYDGKAQDDWEHLDIVGKLNDLDEDKLYDIAIKYADKRPNDGSIQDTVEIFIEGYKAAKQA